MDTHWLAGYNIVTRHETGVRERYIKRGSKLKNRQKSIIFLNAMNAASASVRQCYKDSFLKKNPKVLIIYKLQETGLKHPILFIR